MPIYAYRCESCGHAKDVLQKISDPLLTTCPACGAEQFKKQVTSAGFQLKGSGWYVTDFRGGATPAAGDSGKDSGSGSAADKPDGDKAAPAANATATASAAASSPAPAAAVAPTPAAAANK
jgi:putative FmdB family regulatory protein